MDIPMQRRPVERSNHSQPFAHAGVGEVTAEGIRGVTASGYGVEPSFNWGGLFKAAIPIAAQVLPRII
jgi:hypothetical protein